MKPSNVAAAFLGANSLALVLGAGRLHPAVTLLLAFFVLVWGAAMFYLWGSERRETAARRRDGPPPLPPLPEPRGWRGRDD